MAKKNSPLTDQATREYDLSRAQKVDFGAASEPSAPVGADEVTIIATAPAMVKWGVEGTVAGPAAGNFYLPANLPWTFQLNSTDIIAAVQVTEAGSLYILPVA